MSKTTNQDAAPKLTIVSKSTDRGRRYFTDPEKINGFDGTAQGWGYKSPSAIYAAYNYHRNRHKIDARKSEAKQFLKDNPDVVPLLNWYFDPDWCVDRMKDGEDSTIADLLETYQAEYPNETAKLAAVKHLHRAILDVF